MYKIYTGSLFCLLLAGGQTFFEPVQGLLLNHYSWQVVPIYDGPWDKCIFVCIYCRLNLHVLLGVSAASFSLMLWGEVAGWYFDEIADRLIHHGDAAALSPLFQWLPSKIFYHGADGWLKACASARVVGYESRSSPLDPF